MAIGVRLESFGLFFLRAVLQCMRIPPFSRLIPVVFYYVIWLYERPISCISIFQWSVRVGVGCGAIHGRKTGVNHHSQHLYVSQ